MRADVLRYAAHRILIHLETIDCTATSRTPARLDALMTAIDEIRWIAIKLCGTIPDPDVPDEDDLSDNPPI